ncbi:response regulator transcription factor [Nocardioides sp. cx-169]|uniref:helix-turn-helix transcriptional regulator n=1 Tax=Nocardioides sp. cx-169 TaxID=2899080 RepID=UPI001E607DDB|nr:response regulator transcription factor [Nocardioides sp. cx-169]MCD4535528.1 response regulator transcription factor [Nocardioides sp. cx-169]
MSISVLDRPAHAPDALPAPPGEPGRAVVLSPYELIQAGLESVLDGVPGLHLGAAKPAIPGDALRPQGLSRCDFAFVDSACVDTPLADQLMWAIGQPQLVVVILARESDPALTDRALDLGADGCLALTATRTEIALAVMALRRRHLHADGSAFDVDYRLNPHAAPADRVTDSLSPRELQVLASIALGLSNREIADRMFVSINTVKTYIRTAYAKLRVYSRAQATLWGVEHRVSDLERRARLGS